MSSYFHGLRLLRARATIINKSIGIVSRLSAGFFSIRIYTPTAAMIKHAPAKVFNVF